MMVKCIYCLQYKDSKYFYPRKKGNFNSFNSYCKLCMSDISSINYYKRKERKKQNEK